MKERVNIIKEREQYRPLAPIMMEDSFKDYLDTNYPSPYMTLVSDVLENKKNIIPSVVHID
jgi:carbamoyltransferase